MLHMVLPPSRHRDCLYLRTLLDDTFIMTMEITIRMRMVLMVVVLEMGEVMVVVGMGVGIEVLGHQVVRMKAL